jgi:hypothetical protein
MSPHAQLVLVLGVTGLVAIGSAWFTLWLVWSLAWDLYDYLMQQRTRRRNARFDARVGRDLTPEMRELERRGNQSRHAFLRLQAGE